MDGHGVILFVYFVDQFLCVMPPGV